MEYSELDAELAAINRVEDILRVWYDYDKLVESGFMEIYTNTARVSASYMSGDFGSVDDYIPDMLDLALNAQDGVPISAQDIYKLQRFYKDNEFCFTNLFKIYNSDNDPAFDAMRRRLKRVNEVRVLFGCIMLDELKSYLPQSLDDVTGITLAGKALEFVQNQVKDGITDKINGQLEKIYGSQAKSLAFDVYYAAKYFEKKESFFCSKLDWKNFPFDLYDPNELTGGESQTMPSGPSGMLDPSGVIFEAVESNVIEGAAATLYYFDGTNGVVADSTYFGIEPNPQTVGEDGFYQWFVPVGNWRVVASKDGYTTVDTGSSANYGLNAAQQSDGYYYMPVLPVQLDVNIGLVSYEAPAVESINATTDGVFITFSKYMSEGELTAANIGLYINDVLVPLDGSNVILADSEKVNADSTISYTKTVLLAYPGLKTSDKVQVVISNEVKSYAGVRMAERFDSGSIDVTEPVKLAAPTASVSSGEVEKNTIVTLSAEDGAVIYYTTDGTIPSKTSRIYKTGIFISENITIKAIAVKPGMKDSDVLSVSYTIKDEDPDEDPRPAKVTATMNGMVITDNSIVSAGYLKFTTATLGAQIYYTTNGNCPMTDEENRILYKGPIYLEAGKTYYFRVRAYNGKYSDGLPLHITVKRSGSSGGSSGVSGGGGYRPTTPTVVNNPSIGGSAKSWSEIAAELAKLTNGSEATIELNGNTTVPVEVIKVIDERDLKVTFVVNSINSWKTDGMKITAPTEADLTLTKTASTKHDGLRGIEGTQFRISDTGIPTSLEIAFKKEHAGKFASLYKYVDGKSLFVTCAKLGEDGKVILPDVAEKGDYVVMLCEFSDLPGDMNNDGVLNAMDASAILKDIVGLEAGANPLMADFNGDGKINAMDASAILKRIVGIA